MLPSELAVSCVFLFSDKCPIVAPSHTAEGRQERLATTAGQFLGPGEGWPHSTEGGKGGGANLEPEGRRSRGRGAAGQAHP